MTKRDMSVKYRQRQRRWNDSARLPKERNIIGYRNRTESTPDELLGSI